MPTTATAATTETTKRRRNSNLPFPLQQNNNTSITTTTTTTTTTTNQESSSTSNKQRQRQRQPQQKQKWNVIACSFTSILVLLTLLQVLPLSRTDLKAMTATTTNHNNNNNNNIVTSQQQQQHQQQQVIINNSTASSHDNVMADASNETMTINVDNNTLKTKHNSQKTKLPTIAIVTGYSNKDLDNQRIPKMYRPHLLLKACYAYKHNYDFFLNHYWGWPKERPLLLFHDGPSTKQKKNDRYKHLESGTWGVVPYVEAALDQGYDYVFWNDLDYIFQNTSKPLTEFIIDEWEQHYGFTNVQIFVPNDSSIGYTFNSWAILIKNSEFGRRVVHHWRQFALAGFCRNGNFARKEYEWWTGDQPGLWYALMKTHDELYGNNDTVSIECNEDDGYIKFINPDIPMGIEMTKYFGKVFGTANTKKTNNKKQKGTRRGGRFGPPTYDDFPKDQPILWSEYEYGLGINVEKHIGFRRKPIKREDMPTFPDRFGLHIKDFLPDHVLKDVEECERVHHCSTNYFDDDDDELYYYGHDDSNSSSSRSGNNSTPQATTTTATGVARPFMRCGTNTSENRIIMEREL